MSKINKELLQAFKRSKLTKYSLAKASGVPESTVGRWVREESELSLDNVEKIAKALNVRVILEGNE